MVMQEFSDAVIQERIREAAELRRQQEALALTGRGATPRSGPFRQPTRRLPLRTFLARVFPMASVS